MQKEFSTKGKNEKFLYDYQFLTIDFVYVSYNRSKYRKGISGKENPKMSKYMEKGESF